MTKLNCKLDWFSFTFPFAPTGENDNEYLLTHALMAFHDHTAHRFLGVVTDGLWQWEDARGFYPFNISCPATGIQISFGGHSGFAQATLSGKTCDAVLLSIAIDDLARAANGRATRIDLAVDMEVDCKPTDFASQRTEGRFKSQGNFISETGETVYIGSRQSERFCRVYRYSPPHPRHKYLRVEIECKGDFAKAVCADLISSNLMSTSLSVNLPYGWKHPIWTPDNADVSKLPARPYDREGAGTLRWLETAVVPALKKAHEKGLIDLRLWLNDHFDIEIPE